MLLNKKFVEIKVPFNISDLFVTLVYLQGILYLLIIPTIGANKCIWNIKSYFISCKFVACGRSAYRLVLLNVQTIFFNFVATFCLEIHMIFYTYFLIDPNMNSEPTFTKWITNF